jgi:hypothetical protein
MSSGCASPASSSCTGRHRVPGYAANTAQNVAAGPTVAPVSLATDLAIATIFAVVGVTVYLLLRRIDRRAAGGGWSSRPWPPG